MTMITAQHNTLIDFLAGKSVSLLMRCMFRSTKIHGDKKPVKGPVLLIGNHFSWWDGFMAREVNATVFKRRLHVMMLEEELRKRPLLRKMGAFSIRRNSRGALESIKYAAELLKDPGNLLLLYPQGQFQTTHRYPLTFQNGWYRILEKAPNDTQLFFMVCLSDFFRHQRPGLDIYLADARQRAEIISPGGTEQSAANPMASPSKLYPDPRAVESAYNAFLLDAINEQDKKANEVTRD